MTKPFPAKWPKEFDPDSSSISAESFLIEQMTEEASPPKLHRHTTGQLSITLNGHAGIVLQEGYWGVPVACAAWCPTGTYHCGVLSSNAQVLFAHFDPKFSSFLPNVPQRLVLNSMTLEMLKHVSQKKLKYGDSDHSSKLWEVIVQELSLSTVLPKIFAPLPLNPELRRLTEQFISDAGCRNKTATDVAKALNISERTLRRRLLETTGLTFSEWIGQIKLWVGVSELRKGKTVEEAAYEAGFLNPSSFIVAFKKVFGTTPSYFKRNV